MSATLAATALDRPAHCGPRRQHSTARPSCRSSSWTAHRGQDGCKSSAAHSARAGSWPISPVQQWRSRRRPLCAGVRSVQQLVQGSTAGSEGFVTFEEVQQIAQTRGLEITLKTLGPAYRIVCRDAALSSSNTGSDGGSSASARGGRRVRSSSSSGEARAEEAAAGVGGPGRVLAVTSGFVVPPPLGLMHCDTLQIFTRGQRGEEGRRTRGGVLGLGLLMGAATFAHGRACGCRKAEILAINDDDAWHERLVAYYSRFGFQPVRVVRGDSLADLPHMLVWGGAGTRMDADVNAMLARWTRAVRRNSAATATPWAAGAAGVAVQAADDDGIADSAAPSAGTAAVAAAPNTPDT